MNMLCFSKSKQYKTLGKLGILPALVNINEPIMFGFPIILNPVLAIPFFLVPQINFIIAYVLMNLGVVSIPRIAMGAMGTPLLVNGWILSGVSGLILELGLAILATIMYFPFFKIQDSMAHKKESLI
ncbi:Lichenan permease IIC component [compost metagenome]